MKFNYFKKQQIRKNFIPWLKNETKRKIIISNITDQLVDKLILNTVTKKNIHTNNFRKNFIRSFLFQRYNQSNFY